MTIKLIPSDSIDLNDVAIRDDYYIITKPEGYKDWMYIKPLKEIAIGDIQEALLKSNNVFVIRIIEDNSQ